jgi:hypothetical protein
MIMVQQTPDGLVAVRSGDQVYLDSAAHFALDYGEPAPTLPAGAVDSVYEPGKRHVYTDGVTVVAGGAMPWPDGDRYIAGVTAAIAAQKARIAAIPPPDPPPGG